jgi:alkylation response protein AidB-like acyl-CoA dehydrogenase
LVLEGEKTWTTWLPALRLAIVTARLSQEAPAGGEPDAPTILNVLVDLDTTGVERLPGFAALGMRGSASGRLVLRGVRVAADAIVARRGSGAPDARAPIQQIWFGICLSAVYLGVGEGARARVVRWAIDRRPGDGSTAVADLPTIQLRLGRLDAALRAARIVLLDVAARADATPRDDRGSWAAVASDVTLAKLTVTAAAVAATDEALRIAGGPGFLAGPLERAFRDARAGLINPPLEDVALGSFGRALVERERAADR